MLSDANAAYGRTQTIEHVAVSAALLRLSGAAPFEPMGRPRKEYVVIPPSLVTKPKQLGAWIERGHRNTARSKPANRGR